ncbi:MAG TPA: diguanylate cyclase [Candidatus Hydrogenedentes bacterium]|nr:diguanylate cyclase [Candidatus Hydrogenedentota bacterium]HOL76642.1 diguanylate cyclase [Candidatus Hydrogenedentota bacterium]HPO84475.1 diguanylate cyclase [Candidatus Hydrogenedentota bacterium]
MAEWGKNTILVIDPRAEIRAFLSETLSVHGFDVQTAAEAKQALQLFFLTPPQCILLPYGLKSSAEGSLLNELKSDNLYGHLPIILLLTPSDLKQGLDWSQTPADDYIVEPYSPEEVLSRVQLNLIRATRDLNSNPLTGLPGNLTISLETDRRLRSAQPFAFAYLDIDNFKSYNDAYGFARGDEVLKMTARVVANAVRALGNEETFVGHVGGDDFVFITPPPLMTQVCRRICSDFDLIVRNFYDSQDRKNGFIRSHDRQGNPKTYPLMTVSIGVVDTGITVIQHVADLMTRVVEAKSYAKRMDGSTFLIDRRRA